MIGEEIIDETDLYVDVGAKVKVIRGPAKRLATGKALAPLIVSIIERRRNQTSGDYGALGGASGEQPVLNPPPNDTLHPATQAFDRVKRGGAADRRQKILRGTSALPTNPQNTPALEVSRQLALEPEAQSGVDAGGGGLQPVLPKGFDVVEGEQDAFAGE